MAFDAHASISGIQASKTDFCAVTGAGHAFCRDRIRWASETIDGAFHAYDKYGDRRCWIDPNGAATCVDSKGRSLHGRGPFEQIDAWSTYALAFNGDLYYLQGGVAVAHDVAAFAACPGVLSSSVALSQGGRMLRLQGASATVTGDHFQPWSTVACAGPTVYGVLQSSRLLAVWPPSNPPAEIDGVRIRQLSSADTMTCALTEDSRIACWDGPDAWTISATAPGPSLH